VPGTAALDGVKVKTLLVVVLAALNAAVTPLGSPETDRFTLPLKPFWPTTLIVLLALGPPTGSVRLPTEEERLKPGF